MIDWDVSPDYERTREQEWFFPSFEIQEYLLPQINVGKPFIDIYGTTVFTTDDCRRLKGNIEYLLDSQAFDKKPQIQFESLEYGLVAMSCGDIRNALLKLYEAANQAVERSGALMFFGD
jgi:hypothetical protein